MAKPEAKPEVKPAASEFALILGVRRIRNGAFAGLWELSSLDKNGAVKRIITDANTRSLVISLAAREISKAV